VDPTPVITMCDMYQQVYSGLVSWLGGSDGGSGSKVHCHRGSSHGGLDIDKTLNPRVLASTQPCLSPSRSVSGSFSTPKSHPPYSPNLSWISQACQNSLPCESYGGVTVSADQRSFVQVLKTRLAPIAMVPPRPGRGWGRESFGAGRGGQGGG
jgi:hypothetical protein